MEKIKKWIRLAGLIVLFLSAIITGQHHKKSNSSYPHYPSREKIKAGTEAVFDRKVRIKNYNSIPEKVKVMLKKADEKIELKYYYKGKEDFNREAWDYNPGENVYTYKKELKPNEVTEVLIDQIKVSVPKHQEVENLKEDFLAVYEIYDILV